VWREFPDPSRHGFLTAPFGPGCYELRRTDTGKCVLFGSGANVAYRMTSLLPKPLGQGTRKNLKKRNYVLQHLDNIEYRTLACDSAEEAKGRERTIRDDNPDCEFAT
jgi:hypothetical protein